MGNASIEWADKTWNLEDGQSIETLLHCPTVSHSALVASPLDRGGKHLCADPRNHEI
jgi:hypothetical protein